MFVHCSLLLVWYVTPSIKMCRVLSAPSLFTTVFVPLLSPGCARLPFPWPLAHCCRTLDIVCSTWLQVEHAAADVKVREAAVARREADLARQEAATLSGNADAIKREAELAAREQALAAQLAEIKAAEGQLQEKKLEAKELQVSVWHVYVQKRMVQLSHW